MLRNDMQLIPQKILDQWQSLVDFLAKHLEMDLAFVAMANPPQIQVVRITTDNHHGFKGGEIVSLAGRFCEETIRTGDLHIVKDLHTSPKWINSPESKTGLNSYLGLPLYWPDGMSFGTFCLKNKEVTEYNPKVIALMENFRTMIQAHLELIENNMKLKEQNNQINHQNEELSRLLTENRVLKKFLPICASCKKIRDDDGNWHQLEKYISTHTETTFSHSYCDECYSKITKISDAL